MTDFIISDEGTIEIYDGKCENPAIRIVNPSEFVENYSHLKEFDLLSQKTKHCTICKSEILKTCIAGTVAVPNPNFPREKIGSFCFIAFNNMLLIIEDKPYAVNLIECDSAETPVGARGIIGILFKLLETIVNGELEFLYNTREELERLGICSKRHKNDSLSIFYEKKIKRFFVIKIKVVSLHSLKET